MKLLSGMRADIISLVAGALLPLAFAPFGFYPVAVLSPACLFAVWLVSSPRRAFVRGWLYGVGMFGAGVWWVYVSFYEFGHVSLALSIALTCGFVLFLALYPGLLGYLLTRVFPLRGRSAFLHLAIIYPAAWVLAEWLRGWLFTGFPWLNLGYAMNTAPLGGFAPLLGVYGVSLFVAISAGLLVQLVRALNKQRPAIMVALAFIWVVGGVVSTIEWTRQHGDPIKVSLLQGNISQRVKWLPEKRDSILGLYQQLTRLHQDSQLIIWPETAIPLFYHQVKDDFLTAIEQHARQHKYDLLIGIPYMDPSTRQYYNSMLSLGSNEGIYRKRHLVPFGEYLPFKRFLGGLMKFLKIPMSDFSAANGKPQLLTVAGHTVGISICYEDAFGEEVIESLPQASLLVNVSNDAWFGDSIAPHQHLQIARMRALETGRPLLRATNTGISAVIDDRGRIIDRSPQFKVHVLTAKVQPMQGATLYIKSGNYLIVSLVVLMLAAGFIRARR